MFWTLFTSSLILTNFSNYIKDFNKTYNGSEYLKREDIYNDNLAYINQRNSLDLSYKLGINQFTDMTNTEFNSNLNIKPLYNTQPCNFSIGNVPQEWDWRNHNAVVPIKNQAQCGSCWAFSAIASIEGLNAIKTGELISLSEQQLVDCSYKYNNSGCEGGWMDAAFAYGRDNGICTEEEYQYNANDNNCSKCEKVVKLKSYCDIPNNEDVLLKYVAIQPVSIAIEADSMDFQMYKSGVFNYSECGEELDHGVVLVGYGSIDGIDYWIIRNSWGKTWGEDGYMLMLRGLNMCGLTLDPSIPLM